VLWNGIQTALNILLDYYILDYYKASSNMSLKRQSHNFAKRTHIQRTWNLNRASLSVLR